MHSRNLTLSFNTVNSFPSNICNFHKSIFPLNSAQFDKGKYVQFETEYLYFNKLGVLLAFYPCSFKASVFMSCHSTKDVKFSEPLRA